MPSVLGWAVGADSRCILVTGGQGQIGLELAASAWPEAWDVDLPSRDQLDLADPDSIRRTFGAKTYAAVVNAGAYTAVDDAERNPQAAFTVNAMGPALLAELTNHAGIPLVQVSTDYVFDGSQARPYSETDPTGPLGVYGASKLAGELAVATINPRSVILRTAWVVSAHRNNFLKTMLRVAADRPRLRVVQDQIGCPTGARDVAAALTTITKRLITDEAAPAGIYHFTNGGEASWAELAREIFARSKASGGPFAAVDAILTQDYPTLARRPANSRLSSDKIGRDHGIRPRPWQDAIAEIMNEISAEQAIS